MHTTIAVDPGTRDALERLKRERRLRSLNDVIVHMLQGQAARGAHPDPQRLQRLLQHRRKLADFAKKNGLRRLAVFGSTVRGEANQESDLDVLVEFKGRPKVGLFGFERMQEELSRILGVRVDLQTPASLSTQFAKQVEKEALDLYVAA